MSTDPTTAATDTAESCAPEEGEYCIVDDKTGKLIRLTSAEKERIFLDALQVRYVRVILYHVIIAVLVTVDSVLDNACLPWSTQIFILSVLIMHNASLLQCTAPFLAIPMTFYAYVFLCVL